MSEPVVLPPGSGPAGAPQNVRQPRFGDATGAIILLVLAFAGYLIGVILSFFGFLITGVCAARSCNAEAGSTAQALVAVTLAVVLLLGSGISVALIATRRRAIVVRHPRVGGEQLLDGATALGPRPLCPLFPRRPGLGGEVIRPIAELERADLRRSALFRA